MTDRFEKMVKLPNVPTAKLLSVANVRLDTPITSPVAALPEVVLQELDGKGALVDMLRVLSLALPPRERVWWACLAARDLVGPKSDKDPEPLAASEEWVFKPTEKNVERARQSVDEAYNDDDTVNCAMSVIYSDGKMGPADLSKFPAPAGASEAFALIMNVVALNKNHDRFEQYGQMLVDRAVDIARGGNGRVEAAQPEEEAT